MYLFGFAAALLVGLSKTGVPGVAIPAILLMTEAFSGNEKLSVGALLPLLIVGDVIAVRIYRGHADWNRLWRLFPYVVAGMIPGVLVLLLVENEHFKTVLGWIVLPLLLLEVARQVAGWTAVPARRWFTALAGLLAGFGTTVGNAAGPVMSIYLVGQRLGKQEFLGTSAWLFFLVNLSKLPLFLTLGMITTQTLKLDALVIPMAALCATNGAMLASHGSWQMISISPSSSIGS